MVNNYLTEDKLEKHLSNIYPNCNIVRNRKVPQSDTLSRPDFRIDKHNLLIEFDGYRHYSSTKQIKKDIQNENIYNRLGYRMIRIPYFVQLSRQIVNLLFDVDYHTNNNYPHGFIDKKALLPADFCELGVERFKNDLNKFKPIKPIILKSLQVKVKEMQDIDLVLPPSLQEII